MIALEENNKDAMYEYAVKLGMSVANFINHVRAAAAFIQKSTQNSPHRSASNI